MADTKRVAETAVSTKEASSPGVSKRRRIACSGNAHLPSSLSPPSTTTDHYLECTPASDGDSCLGSSSDRLDDRCCCCRSNAPNDVDDGGDDVDGEESLRRVDLESPNSKTVGASFSTDEPCSKAAGEPAPADEQGANAAGEPAPADEPAAPANDGGELPQGIAPLREELEEFFANAERYELRRFTEKYNFDFANDVPLEGRYEWHPLTP